MDITGRKAAPSEQVLALNEFNAVLRADNTELERANVSLRAENDQLKQKVKYLQVAATILIATSAGSGVGFVTSAVGVVVPTAITSAAAVFFGVIMASIAILTFMRQ
jgi:hypothetical protein